MFRGYLALGGEELANSSRTVAHMTPTAPTSDGEISTAIQCACDFTISYDDTWTGLQAALGDAPYILPNAPWYDAARPASEEFAGIWIMDAGGFDSVPIQRTVEEAICAGGAANRHRDMSRTLTFSAVLMACTNAGARYGLNWLACQLRTANARGGTDLAFYTAHPEDTAAPASSLTRELHSVVLTQSPTVVERMGLSNGAPHRQASVFRVEWEMVATDPYLYGPETQIPVVWDTTADEPITWAHAPDCEDTASCDLPTIYNADCIPDDIQIRPAVIPTCGGCLPLCDIERRTWELTADPGACDEVTISVRITNTQVSDNLTVIFYWQPCGSTDRCDRVHPMQISGLAPGDAAVADSVGMRPYVEVGGVRHRQVGIVSTPTGAPWRPITLDTMMCWELVAESAPGALYDVEILVRERDA